MGILATIFSKIGKLKTSEELMGNEVALKLEDIGIKGKIFCLSMQRSGTSSVGDFLEQWGYRRAGHPLSRSKNWTKHWLNGNYDAIFQDQVFRDHDVFEDDPWWCPDFFKYVFHKVPDSRFILLTRDSDAWFKSMISHSNGFSLGITDIHAKIYRREDDLLWLQKNIKGFNGAAAQAMTVFDKASHYKSAYERHTNEVKAFFGSFAPDALFVGQLNNPEIWGEISEWLALPKKDGIKLNVHTHKTRREFTKDDLLARRG
ncbi:MAG: hypothetical protein KJ795_01430 [Gammaproteobacteria bacterium]|nr:hypothetical protein [Gammaproteobacteria bacterium]MBU1777344.1 hypothetical protein [Gammaproteobacteria bacterium]